MYNSPLVDNGVLYYDIIHRFSQVENCTATSAALCKPAVSLADSSDLRCLLSAMYTMVETLRPGTIRPDDSEEWKEVCQNFKNDFSQPTGGDVTGGESVVITLFGMVSKFGNGTAPHFPMRKVPLFPLIRLFRAFL